MVSSRKKILFILNPVAGGGKSLLIEKKIDQLIDQSRFDHEIVFTERAGHAAELAQKAVNNNFHIVVAAGGDGTINEIAKPLLHTHTALAVIPRGSGNGLARHLEIPLDVTKAIIKINTASEKKVDVIRVNGHVSVNVSGVGFDGWVASEFAKSKKRGLLNYIRLTMSGYKKFPQCQVRITDFTKTIECTSFVVAIANSSQFGNNAFVAPMANIQDGIMDVTIIRKPSVFFLPIVFYLLLRKQIESSKYVSTLRARKISIELRENLPMHIDGEPAGKTNKINAEVESLALRVWC